MAPFATTRDHCASATWGRMRDMWLSAFPMLGALIAALGTGIQALLAVRELGEQRDLSRPAIAVRELRDEFSWWRHPVKRRRQLKLIRELLRESPKEALAYRRMELHLKAWSLMFVGALCAVVAVIDGG